MVAAKPSLQVHRMDVRIDSSFPFLSSFFPLISSHSFQLPVVSLLVTLLHISFCCLFHFFLSIPLFLRITLLPQFDSLPTVVSTHWLTVASFPSFLVPFSLTHLLWSIMYRLPFSLPLLCFFFKCSHVVFIQLITLKCLKAWCISCAYLCVCTIYNCEFVSL